MRSRKLQLNALYRPRDAILVALQLVHFEHLIEIAELDMAKAEEEITTLSVSPVVQHYWFCTPRLKVSITQFQRKPFRPCSYP